MKVAHFTTFPLLRQNYTTVTELGNVINKCRCSTLKRLNGELPFSGREKELIIDDLIRRGLEAEKSPETYKKYFEEAI